VLQVVLAFVSFGAPIVGTLHGINALLIIGAAGRAAALTRTTQLARQQSGGGYDVPAQGTGAPQSTRSV
jgi:hypothetical protein